MLSDRRLLLSAVLFGSLLAPAAASASQPVKSAQACNSEIQTNLAKIRAAGESLPRFFHDCWWNSTPGQPTAIVARGTESPKGEVPRQVADLRRPPRPRSEARLPGVHRLVAIYAVEQRRRHEATGIVWGAPVERLRRANRAEVRLAAAEARAARHRRSPEVSRQIASAAMPGSLPAGTRVGKRVWVKVATLFEAPRLQPAVWVGPTPSASGAASVNCWGQPVLDKRWSQSLVCDGRTVAWSPTRVSLVGLRSGSSGSAQPKGF